MTKIELPFGPCDVDVSGSGPAVLLIHGVLVNASLWDPVAPVLAETHHVIAPNLPIGAHRVAAARRDLVHPEAVADALVTLLDALGIERAAVVGSDTGGAIAQLFAARHPDRLTGLALLSCDAFDHFPPTLLKPMRRPLAIGAFVDLLGWMYRFGPIRRSWLGAGLVLNHPIDEAVIAPWFDQIAGDREVRRDMAAFIRACRPALTHRAADALRTFPHPAMVAWSRGDRLFPEADAQRLAATLPDCELRWITDSRTFSMIDQPEQVLAALLPFLERIAERP